MPNAYIDYLDFDANPPTERDLFFIALGCAVSEDIVKLSSENTTRVAILLHGILDATQGEVN
jgi:hypothetical protein